MQLRKAIQNYQSDGLFARLGVLHDMPWKGKISESLIDIDYMGLYGRREVSPIVEDFIEDNEGEPLTVLQLNTLANIIYAKYHRNWEELYKSLNYEYNPIHNYNMSETETEELREVSGKTKNTTDNYTHNGSTSANSNSSGSSSDNQDNSTYGFNSVSSVPTDESDTARTYNDGTVSSGTSSDTSSNTSNDVESGNRDNTNSRKLDKSGNIGVTTTQKLVREERELWLFDFFQTIYKQVNEVMTIPYYNLD